MLWPRAPEPNPLSDRGSESSSDDGDDHFDGMRYGSFDPDPYLLLGKGLAPLKQLNNLDELPSKWTKCTLFFQLIADNEPKYGLVKSVAGTEPHTLVIQRYRESTHKANAFFVRGKVVYGKSGAQIPKLAIANLTYGWQAGAQYDLRPPGTYEVDGKFKFVPIGNGFSKFKDVQTSSFFNVGGLFMNHKWSFVGTYLKATTKLTDDAKDIAYKIVAGLSLVYGIPIIVDSTQRVVLGSVPLSPKCVPDMQAYFRVNKITCVYKCMFECWDGCSILFNLDFSVAGEPFERKAGCRPHPKLLRVLRSENVSLTFKFFGYKAGEYFSIGADSKKNDQGVRHIVVAADLRKKHALALLASDTNLGRNAGNITISLSGAGSPSSARVVETSDAYQIDQVMLADLTDDQSNCSCGAATFKRVHCPFCGAKKCDACSYLGSDCHVCVDCAQPTLQNCAKEFVSDGQTKWGRIGATIVPLECKEKLLLRARLDVIATMCPCFALLVWVVGGRCNKDRLIAVGSVHASSEDTVLFGVGP